MLAEIQDFLAQRRLAVAGVSRLPNDFSRALFRELRARGYDAIPVNPAVTEIDGVPCYGHVQDIQPPVENVLLMTPPAVTAEVTRECAIAGVRRVWMYRAGKKGAVSEEALALCQASGIAVVPGECPFMFLPHGAWYHRFHGWVRRISGSYPS
jgi:predicted CoA-binding protein